MSDVIYPVSVLGGLSVEYLDGVLKDEFDSGAVNTRLRFASKYFKRRFRFAHGPLTYNEWKYIRQFYAQRNGSYDSFYFRDNVNRLGNAKVRFAGGFVPEWASGRRGLQIILEETTPLRILPDYEEMATAAGTSPLFWYDANRELYYKNAGTEVNGESDYGYFDVMGAYRATLQSGYGMNIADGGAAQYQSYATGTFKSIARASLTGLTALPYTLFCLKTDAHFPFGQLTWLAFGSGGGDGFGLHTDASGNTYVGTPGSASVIGSLTTSVTSGQWASFAVVAQSTGVELYKNAASVASHSASYSFTSGYASVFCDPAYAHLALGGNLNHMMIFPAALSLAQIKAVHNLIGYQYGLATVS